MNTKERVIELAKYVIESDGRHKRDEQRGRQENP